MKKWKYDKSQYAGVTRYIGGIKEEDFDGENQEPDLELFHAYKQAERSPSPYFRQKRDRLLRMRIRKTSGDYNSTSYQLAKVIEALSQTE